ncbi:MAG: hypothetical protein HC769_29490 [Cyanobacteria bacterium CRU_2_1]|nr:hypothetical protein [Cyanobacteria bacterium RU_5_0]NJR62572.1 hypothetical protein [Cyanobacteria bacterium CRU_2_1]
MALFRSLRTTLVALFLVLILFTSSACSGTMQADRPSLPGTDRTAYSQLERGNTSQGQNFGNWVTQTAHELVQDAYVRDNDKLGVVITPQVRPTEVRSLASSLVQGFHKNFPNRDLTVLMYAPDKKLILTAKYDDSTRQIQYQ